MAKKEDKTIVKPFKVVVHERGGKYVAIEVTVKCPYCGQEHTHGFGTGYRATMCKKPEGKGDYWLDCESFDAKVMTPAAAYKH